MECQGVSIMAATLLIKLSGTQVCRLCENDKTENYPSWFCGDAVDQVSISHL